MIENKIKVIISGKEWEYPYGTPYSDIAKDFQADYSYPICLVMADNRLRELHKKLKEFCALKFITVADDIGHKAYKRSAILLLLKSSYDVLEGMIERIQVHFTVSEGYYFTVDGKVSLDDKVLAKIKQRMLQIVETNMPIMKRSINTDDAIKLFKKHGMTDKERLFRYRMPSKVNIYSLNEFEDYFYGYMLPHAGLIRHFELYLYKDGFVMQLPKREEPNVVPPFEPREKLFEVQNESIQWGKMLNIGTVGALNDKISKGKAKDIILVQEALQEGKIAEIARRVADSHSTKFVMIAGPSSSGKTTFSHRLSIQLQACGLKPHPIAVDDYFNNRELAPRDESGKYNFESLEAIDIELFNHDMSALLNGERVELPFYNFKTGKREYRGNYKKLGPHDILVIEGIHGLNDKLSYSLPKANKFKIYISALTQLNVDEHNRIPTTDGRLIRRIIRDARTRAISAKMTINMWESVRRGEESNIFPYQEEADIMFNSALIYELAVLKQYAEPLLFGIDREEPEYLEAKRLLKFLDYFVSISTDDIPKNSMLREFIGGSCFNV